MHEITRWLNQNYWRVSMRASVARPPGQDIRCDEAYRSESTDNNDRDEISYELNTTILVSFLEGSRGSEEGEFLGVTGLCSAVKASKRTSEIKRNRRNGVQIEFTPR